MAGGVWFWSASADRQIRRDHAEAVKGDMYRVKCGACGNAFEMPAVEYVAQLGSQGVKCPKCGQDKAWRVGDVGDDPEQYREEMQKLNSVLEIRTALDAAEKERDRLQTELATADAGGDAAKKAEIRKQLAPVRAKIQALDIRWDELNNPH